MRALSRAGLSVAPAKVGPDYIDPAFHAVATGVESLNLDPWGMRQATLAALANQLTRRDAMTIVEGVMGLFDGATDGTGSTADLSSMMGWPVVLIIDAQGQAASAAAVLRGFATHRKDVKIAGVLFNRVGSATHANLLEDGVAKSGLSIPVLGCLPRDRSLALPSRHLGLVQASETLELDWLLDRMADWFEKAVPLNALVDLAEKPTVQSVVTKDAPLPPLGQRMAIAQDMAFAFTYPHILAGWKAAGAEIQFFSPLANESLDESCDAVFLPGGYPELHAGILAGNQAFLSGLQKAAKRGVKIYGECGGYMVLGEHLIDAEGVAHKMAGLLPISTSFAKPKLHLGYRSVTSIAATPLGPAQAAFSAHEFHYAAQTNQNSPNPLFTVRDALGRDRPAAGARQESVFGSFLHLIDRAA